MTPRARGTSVPPTPVYPEDQPGFLSMSAPCWGTEIDPAVLGRIGRMLLGRVVAVFTEANVALPSRQLWVAGSQPWDCEQVVVSLTGLTSSDVPGFNTAAPASPCDPLISATFTVVIVRCVPQPDAKAKPPEPAEIAAAADVTATDAYLLQKAACRFDMFNAADPDVTAPRGGFSVESRVDVGEAQGGLQGVSMSLTSVVG